MSWGSGGWGSGGWGSGTSPATTSPFRVLLATPINSNTVRVFLSREPRHRSPLSGKDSLNRLNWTISIVSGPGTIPVVETVENTQPRPTAVSGEPQAWSVDLRTDRRVLAATTYLTVAGSAITSAAEAPMAAPPFDRDDHPGIALPRPRRPQRPTAVRIGVDLFYDPFQARFILDAKGDIDVHGGLDALKKRIIRRLLSTPGGFIHLPGYGVGLRVKELNRTTDLADLRLRVARQVRLEDEVARASADVARLAPGVILVSVKVRTRRGEAFGLTFEVPREEGGDILVAA